MKSHLSGAQAVPLCPRLPSWLGGHFCLLTCSARGMPDTYQLWAQVLLFRFSELWKDGEGGRGWRTLFLQGWKMTTNSWETRVSNTCLCLWEKGGALVGTLEMRPSCVRGRSLSCMLLSFPETRPRSHSSSAAELSWAHRASQLQSLHLWFPCHMATPDKHRVVKRWLFF